MEKTHTTALAIFFIATAVVLIGGLVATTVVNQQAAFAGSQQPTNPHKVTICHNPEPGSAGGSGETTTVDANAVAAHVRNHGDYIGACQPYDPYDPEP